MLHQYSWVLVFSEVPFSSSMILTQFLFCVTENSDHLKMLDKAYKSQNDEALCVVAVAVF